MPQPMVVIVEEHPWVHTDREAVVGVAELVNLVAGVEGVEGPEEEHV